MSEFTKPKTAVILTIQPANDTEEPLYIESIPSDLHLVPFRRVRLTIGDQTTVVDTEEMVRLLGALAALYRVG